MNKRKVLGSAAVLLGLSTMANNADAYSVDCLGLSDGKGYEVSIKLDDDSDRGVILDRVFLGLFGTEKDDVVDFYSDVEGFNNTKLEEKKHLFGGESGLLARIKADKAANKLRYGDSINIVYRMADSFSEEMKDMLTGEDGIGRLTGKYIDGGRFDEWFSYQRQDISDMFNNSGSIVVNAVPENPTAVLFGTALCISGLGFGYRKLKE